MTEKQNTPEILNAREAAGFLGSHVETLRRLARRGDIPSFKVGKDWRFRKEALVHWADEQLVGIEQDTLGLVLIVDDDEKFCEAMCKRLVRMGCRAEFHTDPSEGLLALTQNTPDLIVLDLKMPKINGPEFLHELRQTHPMLPVVIATGYPDSALVSKAMQYAPVMLLAKPVERKLLERTVGTVLGNTKGLQGIMSG